MQGKNLSQFINALYTNPEIEFVYLNRKYLVSGYRNENNEYTLQVDTIESSSKQVFYVKSTDIQKCVAVFESSKMFDGQTIYEVHDEITVLYG